MDAVINTSGEVVTGMMNGESFVVETGPDFDPTVNVYALEEITLDPVTDVEAMAAVEAFPTEMDSDYADLPAREVAQEKLDTEQLIDLLRGAVAYVQGLDDAVDLVSRVRAGKW